MSKTSMNIFMQSIIAERRKQAQVEELLTAYVLPLLIIYNCVQLLKEENSSNQS